MKKRVAIVSAVAGALMVAVPFAVHTPAKAATVPAACIVVNGPNGAHLQVGYSPTGPAGCVALP
ncbi:MAG: hypothetical protein JOZ68_10665 [Acidimicrobiia bacterium]|nr:hypothetical protein [Acidimicrobiia bacterium]